MTALQRITPVAHVSALSGMIALRFRFQALYILIQTMGGMLVDLFWGTLFLGAQVLCWTVSVGPGVLLPTFFGQHAEDDSMALEILNHHCNSRRMNHEYDSS